MKKRCTGTFCTESTEIKALTEGKQRRKKTPSCRERGGSRAAWCDRVGGWRQGSHSSWSPGQGLHRAAQQDGATSRLLGGSRPPQPSWWEWWSLKPPHSQDPPHYGHCHLKGQGSHTADPIDLKNASSLSVSERWRICPWQVPISSVPLGPLQ